MAIEDRGVKESNLRTPSALAVGVCQSSYAEFIFSATIDLA
jgi:hypothetical protein